MSQHTPSMKTRPVWHAIGAASLGVLFGLLCWGSMWAQGPATPASIERAIAPIQPEAKRCQTPTRLHMWLAATGAPGAPPSHVQRRLDAILGEGKDLGVAREHHVSWDLGERWATTLPGPAGLGRKLSMEHHGCDGDVQRLSLAWGDSPAWTVSVRPDAPFFLGPWEVDGQELVVVLEVEGVMRDWAALIPKTPEFP